MAHSVADKPPLRTGLMLGALGVVFGDIGTSPIYAFRESLRAAAGTPERGPPVAAVYGVLSLVFWAVVIVVALKYVLFVMRADNDGEGGIIALLTQAMPRERGHRARRWLLLTGLAGACLFFGDAMITPAISVLSAVEGLAVATPVFEPYVVPIAAGVLVVLFAIQYRGSGSMGTLFGPVMAAWFAAIALAGLASLLHRPQVLAALDPRYGIALLLHGGWAELNVLGSVFLALTGAEALYADMGHFGRAPIRVDWFALVMPALVLNYLGQGALVLEQPAAAANPFFLLFHDWLLYPAVALATLATVIASQAVLSGAFTLVEQAIHVHLLPRVFVRRTSEKEAGQVYVPLLNWVLAVAVLGLVFGFRSSDALAAAYGIAVAGTMLATTVLATVVARRCWHWSWAVLVPLGAGLLVVDLAFIAANLPKVPHGGWFPLLVGAVAFLFMGTWWRGRQVMARRREDEELRWEGLTDRLGAGPPPTRVPGCAVYLTGRSDVLPSALLLNLEHIGALHERVVLLTVLTERSPRVAPEQRMTVEPTVSGAVRATLRFGFAEPPCVPEALHAHADTLGIDPESVTYFVGREVPVPSDRPDLPGWQEGLFAFMARNAASAPDWFNIPSARVVEMATWVEV